MRGMEGDRVKREGESDRVYKTALCRKRLENTGSVMPYRGMK